MDRITLTAARPLNNGTWLRLPNGRWGHAALRLIAHHVVEVNSIDWHNLACCQSIQVPQLASMYMVLPQYFVSDYGDPTWRGRMIVRADGGSSERWGTPDVMHDGVPWVFLRNTGAASPFPWVRNLERGQETYFTPDGHDFRQIHAMPARDGDGVLVFDVIGNIRA